MNKSVYGCCSFIARPPVIALLFVAYLLCTGGFSFRAHKLGLEKETPDSLGWYSGEQLRRSLGQFDDDGRRYYALTECSLDMIFPLVYCSLFAGFIAHVYPRKAARWVAAIPLTAMAADLSENFHFAHLACRFEDFDKEIGFLYWTSVLSTATKVVCFGLAMAALILGAAGRIMGWWPSVVASDGAKAAG